MASTQGSTWCEISRLLKIACISHSSMNQLENLFIAGMLRVRRTFEAGQGPLPREAVDRFLSPSPLCYALVADNDIVLSLVADNVDLSSRSLETAAGRSTSVFAVKGAAHSAVSQVRGLHDFSGKTSVFGKDQGMDSRRCPAHASVRRCPATLLVRLIEHCR
jgi:hypothetical protein